MYKHYRYSNFKETFMPHIKKWGNSLALRIPVHLAQQLNLQENSEVEYTIADGILLVRPTPPLGPYTLEQLLDRLTRDNIHTETVTGATQGREIW
jgi:antitoxin MazE